MLLLANCLVRHLHCSLADLGRCNGLLLRNQRKQRHQNEPYWNLVDTGSENDKPELLSQFDGSGCRRRNSVLADSGLGCVARSGLVQNSVSGRTLQLFLQTGVQNRLKSGSEGDLAVSDQLFHLLHRTDDRQCADRNGLLSGFDQADLICK